MRQMILNLASLVSILGAAGALLGLTAAGAQAQVSLAPTARGLGAAGAYGSMARGYQSIYYNPANLMLPGTPQLTFSLGQASVLTLTSGPRIPDYADLFRASKQGPERRDELLAGIPESGLGFEVGTHAPIFTFQYRNFAASVSHGLTWDFSIGRDLVNLYVNAYQAGGEFPDPELRGWRGSYLDFAGAYAVELGPVALGVTGHYYRDARLAQARSFSPAVDLDDRTVELEIREVLSRRGTGWGVDVGAAMQPVPQWTVGATVSNAVSRMNWPALATRRMLITETEFGMPFREWEIKWYQEFALGERVIAPSELQGRIGTTAQGLLESGKFAPVLQTSTSYQIERTRTQLGAGYREKLGEGRLSGGAQRGLSLGVEQKVTRTGFLRAGWTTDLADAQMLGFGLTLGTLDLGVGRVRDVSPDGREREGYVAGIGFGTISSRMFR